MDVCLGNERGVVRRRVLKPLELLQRLRCPCLPTTGLLLDVCGVLYDDSAWRRWLFKLVHRMGLQTLYTPFFRLWRCEYLELVRRGQAHYWEALRLFLRASGMSHGQIDEIEAAGQARREALEENIIPFPGVVNTLTYLAEQDIQLTALSSGCLRLPEIQRRLERIGLAVRFQSVISTADLVTKEPDVDCLEWAISAINQSPRQLAYIGCDAAALKRATQYGLRTVAFNYDEDAEADIFIERFDMLPEVLPFDSCHRAAG